MNLNTSCPRISFGIIVLNGEPFTKYNLRNIYEFAYEIVIAEGASYKASHVANEDGHSSDNTLNILRKFKKNEDPEDKIQIVTAEDEGHLNGFWPGEKDEQSQAFSKRCSGEFLWQLDIDEFYDKADIRKIIQLLKQTKEDTCFTIAAHNYFLSPRIKQVGSYFNHPCFAGEPWGRIRRIFTWGSDYKYYSHRPVTIKNSYGEIIHKKNKVDLTSELGIYMHHYSVFSISKWYEKLAYYQNHNWKYDIREGLNQDEIVRYQNWCKISNQYRTINFLSFSSDSLSTLDSLYRHFADDETKQAVNHMLREFDNVDYLTIFRFNILSTGDSVIRNLWYVVKKLISLAILNVEITLCKLGIIDSINEFRFDSNQKN